MTIRFLGRRWGIWVPLLAGLIVLGLFAVLAILVWLFQPARGAQTIPTAVITMIAAPTSTPLALPGVDANATPTTSSQIVGGIGVGMYVQITGTEGDGLRLRAGPGTDSPPRFLGRESEVFKVKDGPRDASGYTWWYLMTPMDESRSGWAAANYLSVVAAPTETAPSP